MSAKWISLSDEDRAAILAAFPGTALAKKVTKANTRIKVASARGKGMAYQKVVADRLATLLGLAWDNSDDESPIATRSSGVNGEDIILRGEARKRLPFSFEVKNQENMSLVDTVEQVRTNAKGKPWVVVHRRKALPEDVVIISFDTFLELLKRGGF